jgi:hypothetical protein
MKYEEASLMRSLIIFAAILSVMLPVPGRAIEVSGDQWGTWTKENSPYNVVGEIYVPGESTLVIEPGVLVNFQGHYKLIVDSLATLRAIGTVSDSIYFTTQDTATGWHGIRFLHASNNSQIGYCHLESGRATGSSEEDRNGGAIYCYNSIPTISHNTISNNFASWAGGGIYCYNHHGVIESNTICDNSTYSSSLGGGIYSSGDLDAMGPQIKTNTICRNSANLGAGIFCYRSTLIEGNIINNNSAGWPSSGIGIYVEYVDVIIKDNTIMYNECPVGGAYGGGIYVDKYGATITGNVICRNYAGGEYEDGSIGGGVYGSPFVLRNNTIADNSARSTDGIYLTNGTTSTISNSIVLGSIHASGATVTIEYSLIEGGWPGVGNIDGDPLFLNPQGGDYSLSPRSPCIDAGDPTSDVPEGGGDRIDMGALEFRQRFNGLLRFEGYPDFAYAGSVISWDASLLNPTPYPQMIDGWIDFSGPISGVALKYLDRVIQPGEWRRTVEIPIPEFVEEGLYTLKGRVGIYGEAIWDSEVFDIEIMERPKHARVASH